ncbi:DMT family transporter [Chroogloeocystis siderophila]|uniref:EamA family transporter n=1 Tax=Chroogloeocystis siderophila 5.2 s.c.1 TaxID=247279 RepID=A0A1U7HUU9_9CHRO|nr:DMT family transporter [Chroogloeocystis siderophila]OKH27383.1 EamA family transporter [Chroogloeocystis siderophila 5.2 s.c.1]
MVVYLKLILTAVVWGGTFIAGRVIVQDLEPFSAAFCRFAVSSICLLFLTLKQEGQLPRLHRKQLIQVILLGMTGVFTYNAFFFLGLQTIAASRAALIVALNPTFIALGSALFFKDKLTILKIIGIITSLTGAALAISRGNVVNILDDNLSIGDLFLFGCVFSWVAYTLIGKLAMQQLSPIVATTYACLIGTIALFFPALPEGILQQFFQINFVTWLVIWYLGFLSSALGFIWYSEGVRVIGPAKAAIFINLVPVSAILLAAVLLQEEITLSLLVGGILVIMGVFFTNKA